MTRARSKHNLRVLTATGNVERATPPDVFAWLDRQFRFDLDVCATPENAKCSRYFTRDDNGLAQEWGTRSFMNPPFGKSIGDWVRKARDTAALRSNAVVVCVLPSRVDAEWWRRFVLQDDRGNGAVGLARGSTYDFNQQVLALRFENLQVRVWHFGERVAFDGLASGAPFPTSVVVFSSALAPRPRIAGPFDPLRPQFGAVW